MVVLVVQAVLVLKMVLPVIRVLMEPLVMAVFIQTKVWDRQMVHGMDILVSNDVYFEFMNLNCSPRIVL